MRTFLIACQQELPERYAAAVAHLTERGIVFETLHAIHGETFGILSYKPYRRDKPHVGYLNPIAHVGLTLSHYMAWQVCAMLPDDMFMILEDDAEFHADWKERMDETLADAPEDWDMILVGNCNCGDKPQEHVKGNLFVVKFPFCTHGYLVRKKALQFLLDNLRDASLKIDIALYTLGYPNLKVYTVLPRFVDQRGTELFP